MDTLLGLQPAQQAFAHAFAQLQQLQKEAQAKQQAYAQDQLQQDYNTFLLEELQALQLHDPKIQQLEQEIERYASASQLEEARAGLASLTDDNGPYSQLYAIKSILDKVKAIDPDMKSYAERLQQVLIELKELAADAAANSFADLEPADLQALEALQDKINAALLKHRARDVAALQAIQETLLQKSRGLEDQAAELESLQQQSAALEKELWLSAQQLHQQRKDGAGSLRYN